jgi:CheY-like chemotaxis protein
MPEPGMSPGHYVMLSVADNGSGMDEETRSHLFEPFFTTKAPGKGTGLGLATVYGIVKQSGGFLAVHSEPGRGTVFRVYLPASQEPVSKAGGADAEKASAPKDGNETILVVEDEKAVRGFLREALERKGYRIIEAANGREALDKAAEAAARGGTLPGNEGEIRLLLTDVVMAGMNGRELADEVVGLLPGIKVLFISGYADRAIVHQGVIDEGLEFMRKPFTPMDLARKVRGILDGK